MVFHRAEKARKKVLLKEGELHITWGRDADDFGALHRREAHTNRAS